MKVIEEINHPELPNHTIQFGYQHGLKIIQ